MKLIELEPRWIHENVFVFLCPHCKTELLSCKNTIMYTHEQCELFAAKLGEWADRVVPCKPEFMWNFQSGAPFDTMTVTPSLDASASGHWHGHITNGEIK